MATLLAPFVVARSDTTGLGAMHPSLGLVCTVRASGFGEDWARVFFKEEWATATVEGIVVDHKPARGRGKEKWEVKFDLDHTSYWWTRVDLAAMCVGGEGLAAFAGVGEAEAGAVQGEGGKQVGGQVDLRTPESKLKKRGASEVEAPNPSIVRPRRQIRPPAKLVDAPTSSEEESEEGEEGSGSE